MAKAKFSPAYQRLRQLLVEARTRSGMTQVELARRLGKPQSYVSKAESGERRLDTVEFVEFAIAAGADPLPIVEAVVARAKSSRRK